jgi:acyl-CoA synthetase (AMP-forming)/AMP-acid ligase II
VNLADALAHHARARPDRPAILAGDRVVACRDLDPLVRRFARHLMVLGLRQGDVLGIALRDTPEHVVALYAAARMGALALPMDWRWTMAERAALAAHFGARMILAEPDAEPVDGVPNIRLDDALHAAVACAPADTPFPTGAACADLPFVLSLSSGTTGRPKGPVVTQGQFLQRMWTHWIDLGLNSRETYVSATPLYFGGGRAFALSLLFSGGTLVLFPPPWAPEALPAEVARRGATSAFLVPTMLRRLLDLPVAAVAPLRGMRLLLSSGAPLHPWERVAIRDRLCPNFHEYYASTEGGGVSLLRPEDIDAHGDSVGRPVFGVEVRILGDDGQALPPGEVGRLAYRGPGVARAFHNDPEAARDAFHDGWFLPGDLAALDAEGFVTLKGRRRDVIIRGGVNIYPAEVESVLLSDPRVADAAVVGWPSAERGEDVAAFVVPRGAVTEAELVAACRARLAPYKVPRAVFLVAELPRNSAGKVLKAELAARLAKG